MIVAVTGATGFIGRHVVAHLAERGDAVVPVGRPLDADRLAAALHGVNAIVHLAGVVATVREREFFAVNVDLTRAVARAAAASGARMVHVSSLAAAGPAPPSAPRGEDAPSSPMTAYGRSKLEGEQTVAATAGLRWLILRPGIVYGPGDRALLPIFIWSQGWVLPLVGRPTAAYTFVHVRDLVRAIAAAVDSDRECDTMFVGHPAPVAPRALYERVRSVTGGSARIVRIPAAVLRIAALAGDLGGVVRGTPLPINSRRYAELMAEGFVCRVDRLRERLGIVAEVDLNSGLAETAGWYRREKWL